MHEAKIVGSGPFRRSDDDGCESDVDEQGCGPENGVEECMFDFPILEREERDPTFDEPKKGQSGSQEERAVPRRNGLEI